jgi:hypothetical protein
LCLEGRRERCLREAGLPAPQRPGRVFSLFTAGQG